MMQHCAAQRVCNHKRFACSTSATANAIAHLPDRMHKEEAATHLDGALVGAVHQRPHFAVNQLGRLFGIGLVEAVVVLREGQQPQRGVHAVHGDLRGWRGGGRPGRGKLV